MHPLNRLRKLLKKALGVDTTQHWLAEQLGVSVSLIQKIELWKKPMNTELSDMLLVRFGIDPVPLHQDKPKLVSMMRSVELVEALRNWCAGESPYYAMMNGDAVALVETTGLAKLRLLTRIATEHGKGAIVAFQLFKWIERTFEDLDLNFPRLAALQHLPEDEREKCERPFFEKCFGIRGNVRGFGYFNSGS